MTDAAFQEAVELDPGYGSRLHVAQGVASRYNLIQFLALHPHLWAFVKLRMALAGTPQSRRTEILGWLTEAGRMRVRMIEASKKEAVRLAAKKP